MFVQNESKVLPLYSNIASYSYNVKDGWVVCAKCVAICEEGNSVVVYDTYVASQSIIFERSCFLPNIEAL